MLNDLTTTAILRTLHPITGLLYVGAGAGGVIDSYDDWNIPFMTLLEADEARFQKLDEKTKGIPQYHAHHCLISAKGGDVDFYQASNANESSLINPATLQALWKNLALREQRTSPSQTLSNFLSTHQENKPIADINWVFIDCFGALEILQSGQDYLRDWDVISARVIVDASSSLYNDRLGLQAFDAFMQSNDFLKIACQPEKHPSVACAVYLKSWKALHKAGLSDIARINDAKEKSQLEAEQIEKELQRKAEQIEKQRQLKLHELRDLRKKFKKLHKEADENQVLLGRLKYNLEKAVDLIKQDKMAEKVQLLDDKKQSDAPEKSVESGKDDG